jgi:hypothetical protein
MEPLGYIVMQAVMRLSRPVRAYERWVGRLPLSSGGLVQGAGGFEVRLGVHRL